MGLVSLPYLNRVGVYTYWNNIWDNVCNYRVYLFFEIYLNYFFYNLLNDLTFNYIFKFIFKNSKKNFYGYLSSLKNVDNIDFLIYFYLGRIWIFVYQGWYILRVSILLPSRELKRSVIKNVNFLKLRRLYHKYVNNLRVLNRYSYVNYKYRV